MKSPPTRIGRYQVHTPISVGGMAELFLASVSGPGGFRKFVALKRILPSLKHDEGFVAMFLEEARISASLSHANIAQVFELGDSDGEYFLALELIEGHDLGRIVRKAAKAHERLPVWFAASVVRDICLALSHAHGYRSPGGRLLLVLDVMMPGIDGFETCERFRAMPNRRRRCPVIFLSAACSLEERAKGLSVGGDDFLRKPFEGSDLVTRVRAHLQRAAAMASER